ncbi:hypothetical protein [Phenylobacterium immobile]|uniref:hypothetical protein n=1 Tax=Phenylobacterium immobile TaxID=21 RepID=UPI000ABF5C2B|nr:hypothetical protein [Phenylobacterium immobile]
MSLRHTLIVAGLLSTSAIAGCGKMGQLERPGPLFGRTPTAESAAATPAEDVETVRTIDPRDRRNVQPNLPVRTDPIQNTRDPTGKAPQGALPDPFHYPE